MSANIPISISDRDPISPVCLANSLTLMIDFFDGSTVLISKGNLSKNYRVFLSLSSITTSGVVRKSCVVARLRRSFDEINAFASSKSKLFDYRFIVEKYL